MMYVERLHVDKWYKGTPMDTNNGDLRFRLLAPMIVMVRDYGLDATTLTSPSSKVFQYGRNNLLVAQFGSE